MSLTSIGSGYSKAWTQIPGYRPDTFTGAYVPTAETIAANPGGSPYLTPKTVTPWRTMGSPWKTASSLHTSYLPYETRGIYSPTEQLKLGITSMLSDAVGGATGATGAGGTSGSTSDLEAQYEAQGAYMRDYMARALGLMGQEAQDPLTQLRGQLMDQATQMPQLTLSDVDRVVGNQQEVLGRTLQRLEQAMGAGGLFSGAMSTQERARDALSRQAYALYQPQEYAAQEQRLAALRNALAQQAGNRGSSLIALESFGRIV